MDNPLSWLLLVPIVILVVLSAFFSSTETAYSCINQYKLKVDADNGDKKAKLIIKNYERFDKILITTLIGHNVCSVVSSALAATFFFLLLNKVIGEEIWISLISTGVLTIILYILGDMTPKMVAKAMPEKTVRDYVYVVLFFYYIFFPFVWIFEKISRFVKFIFKAKDTPPLTEEDLTNVVEDIEEKGLLDENESDIMLASLDFVDTSVKEVLTKRNNVFYIDIKDATNESIKDIVLNTTYSRIPVCYGSIDKVVGILIVKTYIKKYLKNPNVQLVHILQKPYFVDTSITMDDMLEGFRKQKTHMAVVKKENKVVGIITMEDVLEELVGKIAEPISRKESKKW